MGPGLRARPGCSSNRNVAASGGDEAHDPDYVVALDEYA
jgi:hypothetical protein